MKKCKFDHVHTSHDILWIYFYFGGKFVLDFNREESQNVKPDPVSQYLTKPA